MEKYPKTEIERLNREADIRDIIPDLHGRGTSMYTKCPECGKNGKGKGLIATRKLDGKGNLVNMAKCFSCGFSLAGPVAAEMYYTKAKFPEAVESVAAKSGVQLRRSGDRNPFRRSFCEMQLACSGLEPEDVRVKVPVKGTNDFTIEMPFRRGGIDRFGNVTGGDDEMLIYYYDLYGNMKTFTRKSGRPMQYVRVRWSNPEAHKDIDGKSIKYQTPAGAPTEIYIPQRIRDAYRASEHIETLVIQEGEKKAEKACKHGILSVGIQGIYNIGNIETGLLKDIQYIVQKCSVRNVVLLMDSDWDHLSASLSSGAHIDQRPNQFAKAVCKFHLYVQTLHKLGISVDVWWGHINENERHNKGIDDLLTDLLRDREELLKKDMDEAMHSHDGRGVYCDIHKISSKTDMQIRDYWLLNDPRKFFEKYRDRLDGLSMFRFGRIAYEKDDEGRFREVARQAKVGNFWQVVYDSEKDKKKVDFDCIEAYSFLEANAYFRVHTLDQKVGEYKFVKIDDGIVRETAPSDIRDFVYLYVLQNTKDHDVRKMFGAQLGTLLGSDRLERLRKVPDSFSPLFADRQAFYYLNGQCTVRSEGIEFGDMTDMVWESKVIRRKFRRVKIFDRIGKDADGHFYFNLTREGERCEFLQYIINASNFWRGREDSMTGDDYELFYRHVVNKITALGYLLADTKLSTETAAVVAMDSKMGEVACANGRSGKSLLGRAVGHMLAQHYIDGKKMDEKFMYSGVTSTTRNIFIDDVRLNFDFDQFYNSLAGDFIVRDFGSTFKIPFERAPKIYITTNHAINDNTSSGKDRRIMLAFSDYYNDEHKPIDDFGHPFFDGWDTEGADSQWVLFDNLMAECVQYYFRSLEECWERKGRGAVQPPMQDLDLRTYRQIMGEGFLGWAEEWAAIYLNSRFIRKEAYDSYHKAYPDRKFAASPTQFFKKLKAYCQFKGYHLNPNRPHESTGDSFGDWLAANPGKSFIGEPYKSASQEFVIIATTEYAKSNPW